MLWPPLRLQQFEDFNLKLGGIEGAEESNPGKIK